MYPTARLEAGAGEEGVMMPAPGLALARPPCGTMAIRVRMGWGWRKIVRPRSLSDDERPSKPRRSTYGWSLAKITAVSQRVLHRTASGDSTSSTGTGAISASAM
ncbi:hypothetical protein JB92DRAFT_2833032 [Gautieria morchelliformis]|nr:hypothetical protein JB92DRAFT_2833032 [Gautieria morchelliformis]